MRKNETIAAALILTAGMAIPAAAIGIGIGSGSKIGLFPDKPAKVGLFGSSSDASASDEEGEWTQDDWESDGNGEGFEQETDDSWLTFEGESEGIGEMYEYETGYGWEDESEGIWEMYEYETGDAWEDYEYETGDDWEDLSVYEDESEDDWYVSEYETDEGSLTDGSEGEADEAALSAVADAAYQEAAAAAGADADETAAVQGQTEDLAGENAPEDGDGTVSEEAAPEDGDGIVSEEAAPEDGDGIVSEDAAAEDGDGIVSEDGAAGETEGLVSDETGEETPDQEEQQLSVAAVEDPSASAEEAGLQKLAPSQVQVSSRNRKGAAENLTDGNLATSWQEGVEGAGIGETISVQFDGEKEISALALYLGSWESEELYRFNCRPSKLEIVIDGQEPVEAVFEDAMKPWMITLKEPVKAGKLEIKVTEVHTGEKWLDTCISELEIYGPAN